MKPFEPHPDGRLIPVEHVPCLDASELAWSGIIERGADGDMWPFDELTEQTEYLADRYAHMEVLELVKLERQERAPNRTWLAASFLSTRPGRPKEYAVDAWREFTLVSTRPHFGGKRWWFLCPGCSRQRAQLYLIPCLYSLCRECLKLTYTSRQEHNRNTRHGLGWANFRYLLYRADGRHQARQRRALRRRVRRSGELVAT